MTTWHNFYSTLHTEAERLRAMMQNKESDTANLAGRVSLSEQNQTAQAARLLDSKPLAAASQNEGEK